MSTKTKNPKAKKATKKADAKPKEQPVAASIAEPVADPAYHQRCANHWRAELAKMHKRNLDTYKDLSMDQVSALIEKHDRLSGVKMD